MSRIGKYVKAPTDVKKYNADYDDWLDTGETIDEVTFSVSPSGALTADDETIDGDGRGFEFFVSGGNTGVTYTVLITIVTSGGQTKEDAVLFVVRAN